MKLWVILLISVVTQCVATKVTYNTRTPVSQKRNWSWQNQDLVAEPNTQHQSFQPVSFTVNDAVNQQSNVQSGSSGVAQVFNQYPQQSQQMETVIDDILVSNRQGRNLEGFDEVYSDPIVKNALQQGNDTIARTYIKDKLCSLGLMNCEEVEERRPYYSSPHRDIHPQEVILAQPVTIKPVGRPLPAVPVKRPYGPPKPISIPSFGSGPIYNGPPLSPPPPGFGPPPSFIGPYPAYKKPGFSAGLKPVYEGPLDIDDNKYISDKKHGIIPSGPGIQQHVHHHYHHNDGTAGSGAVGTINPGYGYGNGGTYGGPYNDFEEYKKAFKVKDPKSGNNLVGQSGNNYANRYPVYEKQKNDNAFDATTNNKALDSGKQFNRQYGEVNGIGPIGLGGNFETSALNEDCICVPYEQCSTLNQVGRKDDLYLDIDPRNLNKNIEAESAAATNNGTASVTSVSKAANETTGSEHTKDQRSTNDSKGRSKRETESTQSTEKKVTERDTKDEAQSRLIGNLNKLNVKPTWGVSFGLPQSGTYPINPYAENFVNHIPGYGAGNNGINLGLISVNPHVSVHVTKDEYGEKVVKPFVNLHVTPNEGVVNKLGHLLATKKEQLFGGYGHGHGHYGNYAPTYYPHGSQHYPNKPFYPSHGGPYGPHPHYPTQFHHHRPHYTSSHHDYHESVHYDNGYSDDYNPYYRNARLNQTTNSKQLRNGGGKVSFPSRKRRHVEDAQINVQERQFGRPPVCGPRRVCCRRSSIIPYRPKYGECGVRNSQGINGRIKNPVHIDGDSEFGEYPWQVAILKKDTTESIYVCGGTLISGRHILTAAHCVKTYKGRDLRARLGEWDVNHDVEFFPYIERDIVSVYVHPEFYAGTLYNDIAILELDHDVDFDKNPHISPACLPNKFDDFTATRCWTTGWGKDAFGDYGKYQNILKEVDVPIISNTVCEHQMRRTRLGATFNLHDGFICAGGEEGKDACKGDGGGPMVCERYGKWQLAGVVSWGIGCGQPGIPGVYARVSYYLDWIQQILERY